MAGACRRRVLAPHGVKNYGIGPPVALRALGICLLLGGGAVCAAAEPPMLYRDAHASIEQRVHDLLSRMTLEEKVTQLRSMWQTKGSIEDTEGDFSEEKARGAIPNGIGKNLTGTVSSVTGQVGAGALKQPYSTRD